MILEKDAVDEIIFRTRNQRNRLMMELMARSGLPISSLGFPSVFRIPGVAAKIATIGVVSPARPTKIKGEKAHPGTGNP